MVDSLGFRVQGSWLRGFEGSGFSRRRSPIVAGKLEGPLPTCNAESSEAYRV